MRRGGPRGLRDRRRRRNAHHRREPRRRTAPGRRGCGSELPAAGAELAGLATSFARLGPVAEYGFAWLLLWLIGRQPTADLLLYGRTIDAAEVPRIGLISAVVDPGALLEHATYYAR